MSADAVIHPSSVIEPGAVLGDGVRVGPFCIVGSDVVLGSGVELISHVSIAGVTRIGNGCRIYPNAVLGMEPQNLAHKGGRTTLTVGKNNVIREIGDNSHGLGFQPRRDHRRR
jgi:UDP-N-acetylglucosamine acyltransferase